MSNEVDKPSEKVVENHSSYGMLDIYRSSGSPQTLFGSSIEHGHTITFRITGGSKVRDLSRFWYHQEEPIVEIEMSPTQFIDAITNMNTSGVPCTIRSVGGVRREPPPKLSIKKLVEKEFERDLHDIMDNGMKALTALKDSLESRNLKRSDVREAINKMDSILRDIKSNLPFVNASFKKQMDKTITEAKGEIEAAFTNKIHSLGSAKLVEELEKGLLSHTVQLTQTTEGGDEK